MLAYVIREYKPTYRTGNLIVMIDIAIIALNVLFFRKIEIGLYSAIAIYLMGKVIDVVFEGVNFTKMIYIVSDKYYSLKSGDIIVITPQEVHKAVLRNNCLYERFYILVPVHMFSRFVFDPLEKMLNRSPGSPALVSLR